MAKILFSALDWGLGHTTRCIPILKELSQKHEIIVGCDSVAQNVLSEIPNLQFLPLAGYNVHYKHNNMLWGLLKQFPKIKKAIALEKEWVAEQCQKLSIDLIISDNRFGFYHPSTPSIYITHQLNLAAPKLWSKLEWFGRWLHRQVMKNFSEIWIPDFEDPKNKLAGKLSSYPPAMPHTYLGAISRFQKEKTDTLYNLLILLSGPEPQRTILENKVLEQLQSSMGKVCLVRGLPQGSALQHKLSFLEVHNHLNSNSLALKIQQSKHVLCRGGYTTLMDLYALGKSAILVPTPGQTEQEYLAYKLHEQNGFIASSQSTLNLSELLKKHSLESFTSQQNIPSFSSLIEKHLL